MNKFIGTIIFFSLLLKTATCSKVVKVLVHGTEHASDMFYGATLMVASVPFIIVGAAISMSKDLSYSSSQLFGYHIYPPIGYYIAGKMEGLGKQGDEILTNEFLKSTENVEDIGLDSYKLLEDGKIILEDFEMLEIEKMINSIIREYLEKVGPFIHEQIMADRSEGMKVKNIQQAEIYADNFFNAFRGPEFFRVFLDIAIRMIGTRLVMNEYFFEMLRWNTLAMIQQSSIDNPFNEYQLQVIQNLVPLVFKTVDGEITINEDMYKLEMMVMLDEVHLNKYKI